MSQVTSVVIPSTPAGPTAPAAPTPERPAWLPEKFKDPAALAAAYTELEKKLGTPPATEPANTETKVEPVKTETPAPVIADLSKYESEFAESGKLSDESYAALAKAGHSKAVVDNYIAGQQARATAAANEVFEAVGGKDNYTQMVTWAATALAPADRDAYNAAMATGDVAKVKLAVAGLQQAYTAAHGTEPRLVGGTRGSAGVAPYDSVAQLKAAMSDPKYATDPAYRKSVEERLSRSNIL